MSCLRQLYLVMPFLSLAPSSRAFVPTAIPSHNLPERIRWPLRRERVKAAPATARLRSASRRCGPRPLLSSARHDTKDTKYIISEMQGWARHQAIIAPETYDVHTRGFEYMVSSGTSLPEVLFDFWKAVSAVIDEHRSTENDRSFRKLIMFVAPYCEELKDYQTMEHVNQLLQQSARDGGCGDFGRTITHSHYHPNYRFRPRPKQTRMASRHSPYPAFSIEVFYRTGGLKTLASSMRSLPAEGTQGTRMASAPPLSPQGPRATDDVMITEVRNERARRRRDEWMNKTRSTLEHIYNAAASYGTEDGGTCPNRHNYYRHSFVDRGISETSQEVLEMTQAWLRGALKDAVESDAAAAKPHNFNINNNQGGGTVQETSPVSALTNNASLSSSVDGSRDLYYFPWSTTSSSTAYERSTMTADEPQIAGGARTSEMIARDLKGPCGSGEPADVNNSAMGFMKTPEAGGRNGGPGLEGGFAYTAEHMTVRDETRQDGGMKEKKEVELLEEDAALFLAGDDMSGKELVKRMQSISQHIIVRSETAEEAFGDVWEIISEMSERAAARGCSVPTEDYTSRSAPCYGALLVTPDLATYSSDAFSRFQEILNRGLRHLPMEHDISVEAFHPEKVSDVTSGDHRFIRSPFPALHLCYHGLRGRDTPMYPKADGAEKGGVSERSGSGSGSGSKSSGRKKHKKKRRN